MKRGEVWWVELEPVTDGEIVKTRPCLVVSPDEMIEGLPTAIVVPIARGGRAVSFRPPVSVADTQGLLVLDQLRAVDKTRLKTRMGELDGKSLGSALAMLREIFAS